MVGAIFRQSVSENYPHIFVKRKTPLSAHEKNFADWVILNFYKHNAPIYNNKGI